jgi:FixJ family two-component response regulator
MKLFILDDNETFAALSAEVARAEGWQVEVFHRGAPFVDRVNAESGRALLIVDMNLPGLDGFDVTTQLCDPGRRFRLRFITGDSLSTALAGRMAAEARDFAVGRILAKPLGVEGFRAVLAEEAAILAGGLRPSAA